MLEAYGAFGEKTMYGKKVTGVIRSTFVVDEDGKVEQAQYNVKATGHVAKLLRIWGFPTRHSLSRFAARGGRSPIGRGTRFRSVPV